MKELIRDVVTSDRIKAMSRLNYEAFVVLYVCEAGSLKGKENFDCTGSKDCVPFPDARQVIANCRWLNTRDIILVHNHPHYISINTLFRKVYIPEPSDADISATKIFTTMLQEEGIKVVDHIIVTGDNRYFSFWENGLMKEETTNVVNCH